MHWLKTTAAVAALLAAATPTIAPFASAQQAIAPLPRPERLVPAEATLADMVANAAGETAYDDLISPEELDVLVAPVALYPDALLAQVLVAAAYPLQIVEADRLLAASDTMTDDELTRAMEQEDWDPSVLVLATGFPTVITRMAEDLDWTERLGAAMLAQDEDVLAAVQRKRAEALDTGYLASNAAQVVEKRDQEIYIRPADPDVVYVPSYDPTMAFTSAPTAAPYIQPRDNLFANPLVTGAMAFGAGLLVSELFDDDDGGGGKNKNKKKDGWERYWDEPQPIDWRYRQFYPRPQRAWYDDDRYAWSRERDDAWDRSSRKWRPSRELVLAREAERQETLAHITRDRARSERLDELRRAAAEARKDADRQRDRAQAARRQLDAEREKAERQREESEARETAAERERREAQQAEARERQRADREKADASQRERAEQERKAAQAQQQTEARERRERIQARAAREEARQADQKPRQPAAQQPAAAQQERDAQQQRERTAAQQRQQERERAAARKQQQEREQAAAQKQQQEREQAAAQKQQQERERAAAQKQQQEREQAAAQKQQQEREQAAAQKQQQEREQAAAQKQQQDRERAAAQQQQQAREQAAAQRQKQERAAAQKQQQAREKAQPARQTEPARAAPERKQASQAQQQGGGKAQQKKAKCADGKGKDCKRN